MVFDCADDFNLFLKSWDFDERIICDFVEQHEYSEKIFSGSTNTIRVITVMNHETDKAYVVYATHRFGTEKSKPVDNISSGGLCCLIDVDSGMLGKLSSVALLGESFNYHPDSKATVVGTKVPNWEKIKETVIHVHNCFPYYEFLAWDIVLDKNGDVFALEINRGSDLNSQIICPLRNEPIGKWMREKNLLKNF